MTNKQRKYRSNEDKVKILREHLIDKVSVSDICKKYSIAPSLFYVWQKQLFDNGSLALGGKQEVAKESQEDRKTKKRLNYLEEKLKQREEVISELMSDHITLKKKIGEL